MSEKIPQHSHCRQCGKAFIGDEKYCSDDCKAKTSDSMRRRRRQLILLYVATFIILIVAVLAMSV